MKLIYHYGGYKTFGIKIFQISKYISIIYSIQKSVYCRFCLGCVSIDVDAVQGLGKKCSMIFLIISLALVTPSTTIFLIISSTFFASILILAAKSLISFPC